MPASANRSDLRPAAYDVFLAVCNGLLSMPGHSFRLFVLRRLVQAVVGEDTAIERGVTICSRGGLRIGSNTNVNAGTVLDARGGLEIGSLVNISPGVTILSAEHDVASPTFEGRTAPVRIDDRAWIATGAMVLPGTRIAEGAVVAAGAVVHEDVPPWTIVAGNPAREIGRRPSHAQQSLPRYARWLH